MIVMYFVKMGNDPLFILIYLSVMYFVIFSSYLSLNLQECFSCGKDFGEFDKKHHCRACGQGFCDDCTTKRVPVPERGWGDDPVRVCDECARKNEAVNQVLHKQHSLDLKCVFLVYFEPYAFC